MESFSTWIEDTKDVGVFTWVSLDTETLTPRRGHSRLRRRRKRLAGGFDGRSKSPRRVGLVPTCGASHCKGRRETP